MLSENQFFILKELDKNCNITQRELADKVGLAVSSVNENLQKMRSMGLVRPAGLTTKGKEYLESFRVDNAIIMAAGMSTRFAPISYEMPKGLVKINGEVLIERQIRQLQEAGIKKIIIIVGYMKEQFFYLEEKFGVELVVNADYYRYNNISSLYRIKERLGNSYICSSDNYFIDNVFEPYVYEGYYSCVYQTGDTKEWCVETNRYNIINAVTIGGHDSYVMLGHAYFSRDFSTKFCRIMEENYNKFGVTDLLWEKLYIQYLNELKLKMRVYEADKIREFDTIDDIINFDNSFLNTVESEVLDNITGILKCRRDEISEFVILKQGLTNHSFRFKVGDIRYVYRHPGEGTSAIINRTSEKFSQEQAFKLGIDRTYIYMDAEQGWKLARYLENNRAFDYTNDDDLSKAMSLLRQLHATNIQSKWEYNLYKKAEGMFRLIQDKAGAKLDNVLPLREKIKSLYELTEQDNFPKCLCHVDCLEANFLTDGNIMYLIDWEYSGQADAATDLGTMLCCADYSDDDIERILQTYFGRPLTHAEESHYKAYIALAAYCWYIWAIYKESLGHNIGDCLLKWYRYAVKYSKIAETLYEQQ